LLEDVTTMTSQDNSTNDPCQTLDDHDLQSHSPISRKSGRAGRFRHLVIIRGPGKPRAVKCESLLQAQNLIKTLGRSSAKKRRKAKSSLNDAPRSKG
jgi:hypothetical protein